MSDAAVPDAGFAPARRVLLPATIGGPSLGPLVGRGVVRAIEGRSMGTTWRVRCATVEGRRLEADRGAIEALLDALVDDLSHWEPDSALTRFVRAPIDVWHALPDALVDVLACAREVHAASGGAFDPTVARAVSRWGFGPVDNEDGDARIGFDAIELDAEGRRARRLADVALDLGGIAKGYAVDRLSLLLTARGVEHHLVEIGGELRGAGVKPDGLPWWVALEQPPDLAADPSPIVAALHGSAIATSGDYRHCIVRDGLRLTHTIDPATGGPVHDAPASVTVLHADCVRADAEATAITVLGAVRGLAYAERLGLAARIVSRRDGGATVRHTRAFDAMLA